ILCPLSLVQLTSHMIKAVYVVHIFFVYCSRSHPDLHSFPTRRSSDLNELQLETSYEEIEDFSQVKKLATEKELLGMYISSNSFRSEEHTSELQSRFDLVCRLLLEKKNYQRRTTTEPLPRRAAVKKLD